MIATLIAIAFSLWELSQVNDGLHRSATDHAHIIQGLRKSGFKNVDLIRYFEGHLGIIDEKNQSMLAFGANYLAVVGGSFYFTDVFNNSPRHLWSVYATAALIALALVTSFAL